jgi:c-di-GMP-binding flagellar brake protein YcgR
VLRLFGIKPKAKLRSMLPVPPKSPRATVRVALSAPGEWRYAVGGKGSGAFLRCAMTDLSRTGAALTVERPVKTGIQIELKLAIGTAARPLVLLGEIVRVTKVEASGKSSVGLRFLGITPEEDRTIMEFIYKRQAELRSRGLA